MIILLIILLVVFVGLTTALTIGCLYLWNYVAKASELLFDIEDELSKMLSDIRECELVIKKVQELPVAFDSPQVRDVVNAVKRAGLTIESISERIRIRREKK